MYDEMEFKSPSEEERLRRDISRIVDDAYDEIMREKVLGVAQYALGVMGSNEQKEQEYLRVSKDNYTTILLEQLDDIRKVGFDYIREKIIKKTGQEIKFEEFAHEYARESLKQRTPLDCEKRQKISQKTINIIIKNIVADKKVVQRSLREQAKAWY